MDRKWACTTNTTGTATRTQAMVAGMRTGTGTRMARE